MLQRSCFLPWFRKWPAE